MNGLFLYEAVIDPQKPSGVEKKILAQIKAFNDAGLNCRLFPFTGGTGKPKRRSRLDFLRRRLPFSDQEPPWLYHEAFDRADYLYFRKPSYMTYGMRKVLGRLKAARPRVKVVMEIPTYPYDSEYLAGKDLPYLWKDRHNRRKLAGLVDLIAYISDKDYPSIFGIPAVRIINGIDLSGIQPREPLIDDTIDICAVANFSKWHGFERLILGLREYCLQGGTRKFKLHFAGRGLELDRYRQLASDPLIRDKVIFYDTLSGDALDELYNAADFGACSMGLYKTGVQVSSELKSREYLAKGLPVISGCEIDILSEKTQDFYQQHPGHPAPIDFRLIVPFYDRIYSRADGFDAQMQAITGFAKANIDISVTMQPVINYLSETGAP